MHGLENFNSVVNGQFLDTEATIKNAVANFKRFLREGPTEGKSIEAGYAEIYEELIMACGFDETRVRDLIDECLGSDG